MPLQRDPANLYTILLSESILTWLPCQVANFAAPSRTLRRPRPPCSPAWRAPVVRCVRASLRPNDLCPPANARQRILSSFYMCHDLRSQGTKITSNRCLAGVPKGGASRALAPPVPPPLVQAPRPTRTERPPSSDGTAFALCVSAHSGAGAGFGVAPPANPGQPTRPGSKNAQRCVLPHTPVTPAPELAPPGWTSLQSLSVT